MQIIPAKKKKKYALGNDKRDEASLLFPHLQTTFQNHMLQCIDQKLKKKKKRCLIQKDGPRILPYVHIHIDIIIHTMRRNWVLLVQLDFRDCWMPF